MRRAPHEEAGIVLGARWLDWRALMTEFVQYALQIGSRPAMTTEAASEGIFYATWLATLLATSRAGVL
jgi:hypothetical protein